MTTDVRVGFFAGALIGAMLLTPIAAFGQAEMNEPEPVEAACPEHACCYECCAGASPCTIFDYLEFANGWVLGDPCSIDFDTSTGVGVADVFDFLAFQTEFIDGVLNGSPC